MSIPSPEPFPLRLWIIAVVLLATARTASCDWPQWGGTSLRNDAPAEHLPVQWQLGEFEKGNGRWRGSSDKQIRWVARLGSECYGSPVIAAGKIYCGTNNGAGYLPRYPAKPTWAACWRSLLTTAAFSASFPAKSSPAAGPVDWPQQGICCAPLVEGNRLWTVTNRGECFAWMPIRSVAESPGEPKIVWALDMPRQLGIVQHYMCSCSVAAAGELLLVCTSNGVDEAQDFRPGGSELRGPEQQTGEVVWSDASPGENILEGQWASPASAVLGGVPQAIFGGGDGWLYSFLAQPTSDRKAKLLEIPL